MAHPPCLPTFGTRLAAFARQALGVLAAGLAGLPAARAQAVSVAGLALNFNGATTYVDGGTDARAIRDQLTVEAWVNTSSLREQLVLAHCADSLGLENGFVLGTAQGRAFIGRRAEAGAPVGSGLSGSFVADGRWHHLAGQVDGRQWRIFVDGELTNAATVGPTASTLRAVAPLRLGAGRTPTGPERVFDGEIDEVRLWNVVRPVAALRQFMCSVALPVSPGAPLPELVGYYQFDVFTPLTTPDLGSRPVPGSLIGTTNGARRISGAPLGTTSTFGYASGPALAALQLRLGPVSVSNFAAPIRGVHLYAATGYGVFAVGLPPAPPSSPDTAFLIRYQLARGTGCVSLQQRYSCLAPWQVFSAGQLASGMALVLLAVRERGEIKLISAPPPYAYITGDAVLCAGAPATLRVVTAGPARFRWNTGDTTTTVGVTAPGHYSATVAFGNGCPPQQCAWEVRWGSVAPPFALGRDTTICAGTTLMLAGPAGAGLRYDWDDGLTQRTRTVGQPGMYALTVRGDCGPSQMARRRVAVRDCFIVPTVITPNGDGRNDRFVVQEATPSRWQLTLTNRWGVPVLATDRYRHDWGPGAAPGIYQVMLRRPADGYAYRGWLEVLP